MRAGFGRRGLVCDFLSQSRWRGVIHKDFTSTYKTFLEKEEVLDSSSIHLFFDDVSGMLVEWLFVRNSMVSTHQQSTWYLRAFLKKLPSYRSLGNACRTTFSRRLVAAANYLLCQRKSSKTNFPSSVFIFVLNRFALHSSLIRLRHFKLAKQKKNQRSNTLTCVCVFSEAVTSWTGSKTSLLIKVIC